MNPFRPSAIKLICPGLLSLWILIVGAFQIPKAFADEPKWLESLKQGILPPDFVEEHRIVRPDSETAKQFDEKIQKLAQKIFPDWNPQQSPFRFLLIDSPELDAYSIPQSHPRVIGLSKGLLQKCQTLDEFLFVVAHEMNHTFIKIELGHVKNSAGEELMADLKAVSQITDSGFDPRPILDFIKREFQSPAPFWKDIHPNGTVRFSAAQKVVAALDLQYGDFTNRRPLPLGEDLEFFRDQPLAPTVIETKWAELHGQNLGQLKQADRLKFLQEIIELSRAVPISIRKNQTLQFLQPQAPILAATLSQDEFLEILSRVSELTLSNYSDLETLDARKLTGFETALISQAVSWGEFSNKENPGLLYLIQTKQKQFIKERDPEKIVKVGLELYELLQRLKGLPSILLVNFLGFDEFPMFLKPQSALKLSSGEPGWLHHLAAAKMDKTHKITELLLAHGIFVEGVFSLLPKSTRDSLIANPTKLKLPQINSGPTFKVSDPRTDTFHFGNLRHILESPKGNELSFYLKKTQSSPTGSSLTNFTNASSPFHFEKPLDFSLSDFVAKRQTPKESLAPNPVELNSNWEKFFNALKNPVKTSAEAALIHGADFSGPDTVRRFQIFFLRNPSFNNLLEISEWIEATSYFLSHFHGIEFSHLKLPLEKLLAKIAQLFEAPSSTEAEKAELKKMVIEGLPKLSQLLDFSEGVFHQVEVFNVQFQFFLDLFKKGYLTSQELSEAVGSHPGKLGLEYTNSFADLLKSLLVDQGYLLGSNLNDLEPQAKLSPEVIVKLSERFPGQLGEILFCQFFKIFVDRAKTVPLSLGDIKEGLLGLASLNKKEEASGIGSSPKLKIRKALFQQIGEHIKLVYQDKIKFFENLSKNAATSRIEALKIWALFYSEGMLRGYKAETYTIFSSLIKGLAKEFKPLELISLLRPFFSEIRFERPEGFNILSEAYLKGLKVKFAKTRWTDENIAELIKDLPDSKELRFEYRYGFLDEVAQTLELPENAARALKSTLVTNGGEVIEKSTIPVKIAEGLSRLAGSDIKFKKQLVNFLSYEIGHPKGNEFRRALSNRSFDVQDEVVRIFDNIRIFGRVTSENLATKAKFLCEIIHLQYWNLPFEARILFLATILEGGAKQIEEIEAISKEVSEMIIEEIFKSTTKYSDQAKTYLKTYLQVIPNYQRLLFLTAAIAATRKAVDENETQVGEMLSLILTQMGPAETKFAQGIHSYPYTPENIRDGMKGSKSEAALPARWDLFDWIQESLDSQTRSEIAHFGKVLGGASFWVTIEITTHSGEEKVLQILRPYAHNRADRGFDLIQKFILELTKNGNAESNFGNDLVQILEHAKQMALHETDTQMALRQSQMAEILYSGVEVHVGKRAFKFKPMTVEKVGPTWKISSKGEGVHFNNLPNRTKAQVEFKKDFARAYLALEFSNILSGGVFDSDRHGSQLKINPKTLEVSLFDFGGMLLTPPNDLDRKLLGEFLLEAVFTLKTGNPEDLTSLIVKKVRELNQSQSSNLVYMLNIQQALLALGDFLREVPKEDLEGVILTLVQQGHVHGDIKTGFISKLATKGLEGLQFGMKLMNQNPASCELNLKIVVNKK